MCIYTPIYLSLSLYACICDCIGNVFAGSAHAVDASGGLELLKQRCAEKLQRKLQDPKVRAEKAGGWSIPHTCICIYIYQHDDDD